MKKRALLIQFGWLLFVLMLLGCTSESMVNDNNEDLELLVVVDAFPMIDGIIQPGEWDQADVEYFEDGSELYMMRSGDYLYLAIRALPAEMIASNVFLQQGDRVSIFHSSAALGTAIYQQKGESWQKVKDFVWCCRSKIDNESGTAAREEFFEQSNWIGANSYLGNENELEYKIRIIEPAQALAVNFLRAENPDSEKTPWPVGLEDGSVQPSPGGYPETMDFSLEQWGVMEDVQWIR